MLESEQRTCRLKCRLMHFVALGPNVTNHHTFSSKHMAFTLKKEFDRAYGPAWHCIVGTSFGSFVTFSVGGFLYFSIDKVSVLLFQTAVERLG